MIRSSIMVSNDDFEFANSEFGDKTEEELLEEFMNEETVAEDAYISLYGLYVKGMRVLTSAAKDLFMWMAFNCEVDKGRIVMQSFAQETALSELGITVGTYYRCLGELKSKEFIRGNNAKYYINPRIAWKGCISRRQKFMYRFPHIPNDK